MTEIQGDAYGTVVPLLEVAATDQKKNSSQGGRTIDFKINQCGYKEFRRYESCEAYVPGNWIDSMG